MHGNAWECIRARARLYPGLDLERISLAARALATRALCLFLLSDVFRNTCLVFVFMFYVLCFMFYFYVFLLHVFYATRALCLFLLSDVFATCALCLFLCFIFIFMFFCYTCFMFVFLTLTIPRSLYVSECEILTALPNYWAPSFLSESHGR